MWPSSLIRREAGQHARDVTGGKPMLQPVQPQTGNLDALPTPTEQFVIVNVDGQRFIHRFIHRSQKQTTPTIQ